MFTPYSRTPDQNSYLADSELATDFLLDKTFIKDYLQAPINSSSALRKCNHILNKCRLDDSSDKESVIRYELVQELKRGDIRSVNYSFLLDTHQKVIFYHSALYAMNFQIPSDERLKLHTIIEQIKSQLSESTIASITMLLQSQLQSIEVTNISKR
jgi:hypothetical protein